MRGQSSTLELTPAQHSVVEQPWDARTLVTAGAGAGKTTTLTHRLEHLNRAEELSASEILVLSFSRAAVRELRDRVDRLAKTSRSVRAQTFDGWALAVLRQADPGREDLEGASFDDRIAMATEAIAAGVLDSFEFGPPAHVVIDEVQDLVGVRRAMVETLLAEYRDNCGFTVVGDAAQSVYGFQIQDADERAWETNRFFGWIRESFPEDLVEVTLSENFRARTEEARIALPLGPRLQSLPKGRAEATTEACGILDDLRGLLDSTPDFGDLSDLFVQQSLRIPDLSTAILCRDNGQVLWLSDRLRHAGIPHGIQRSPRSRPVPPWVAWLLEQGGGAVIDEQRFKSLVEGASLHGADLAQLWRSLRRVASAPRSRLDLAALRRAVAEGRMPEELTIGRSPDLLLSTVHRAKGLEFDRVLVATDDVTGRPYGDDPDLPAEARLLYVAMTRARDDLFRLSLPRWRRISKGGRLTFPVDRWWLGGVKDYQRNGLEALETDVDHAVPAGAGTADFAAPDVQWYLRDRVGFGDEVELRLLHELPMAEDETPPYAILHGETMIGEASAGFRRDLLRVLRVNRAWELRRGYPQVITGLRVDAVETVAGSSAVAERAGLGDTGVWIAPRLCGLGRFRWSCGAEEGNSVS
ncbi:UvrD-helicase domain-containing protein [Tomitella fengzijianii]|uniref:DNA 3'-5' helicase n=1 Tax=Tomitella fengzijianii TaxID=2597660 RepID=A0A516X8G2_9ACTN|nr:UvrD-helicase domain-containing protein [Tomitella fengzijianii]QDQ98941.1 ATP-dependent helicase [Tomitella fengzijianii]